MPCPDKHQVLKVLTGALSPGKSNEMLEHCRRCGECREAFDFAAKTMTRSATAGPMLLEQSAGASGSGEVPRFPGAWPHPVRRNRRTLIVVGIAIAALMLAGIGKDRPATSHELVPEAVWKRSLSEGTPVVQSPAAAFEARPRVITALLPLGCGSLRVTILDDAGVSVLQRDEKPGTAGCFVEEITIDAPGGAFRAGRLMTAFPDAAALRLDPGRSYGVVVSIGGGHASSSSVFQVAPAPVGLQGPTGEGR